MSAEQNKNVKLEGVKGEWQEKTLGEILILQRGFDLPETNRQLGRYLVIASNGPVGKHSKAMVKGPGVVIGRSGNLGGGQYIEEDFWPLNTTLWVKDFKNNDIRFCYYLLKSLDLSSFNSGSGVPTLNRNHIHPLPVSIPNRIEEQKAIAHILGTLDDKIELNRRTNETLEAMAQALFKFWFVDFGPVRAKMEGRWRRGQSLPGLPAHLFDLFPDRLVDSELGEIPEGWEVKAIGELAEIVGGSTPDTTKNIYWEDGIHFWVTPKDLSNLNAPALLSTKHRITNSGLSQISSGLLPPGTVLLSSRAPIGYLAVTEIFAAINQGFIAMKPKPGISNLFLLLWAHSAHDKIVSRANGSTFLEINKTNFRTIPVEAPPESAMFKFDQLSRSLYEQIVQNLYESHALATIRDTLLPKLISGKLRVKDAEKIIGG